MAGKIALLATAASFLLAAGAAEAGGYKAPRDAYRHPSFDGTWTNGSLTTMERPAGTPSLTLDQAGAAAAEKKIMEDRIRPADPVGGRQSEWWDSGHLAKIDGRYRTSWLIEPADGKLSFTPEATAAIAKMRGAVNNYSDPESRNRAERCLQGAWGAPGPPFSNSPYNNNYKFVQTRDQIGILSESNTDLRIIRIGATHAPAPVRAVLGDSVGHWEGETLVVETTNFEEDFPLRKPPFYLSAGAKVVERFTRVGPSEIRYAFVVEDASVLTTPARGEMPFHATNAQLYEVACHEGNYSMFNILAGAREAEKSAAAGKP